MFKKVNGAPPRAAALGAPRWPAAACRAPRRLLLLQRPIGLGRGSSLRRGATGMLLYATGRRRAGRRRCTCRSSPTRLPLPRLCLHPPPLHPARQPASASLGGTTPGRACARRTWTSRSWSGATATTRCCSSARCRCVAARRAGPTGGQLCRVGRTRGLPPFVTAPVAGCRETHAHPSLPPPSTPPRSPRTWACPCTRTWPRRRCARTAPRRARRCGGAVAALGAAGAVVAQACHRWQAACGLPLPAAARGFARVAPVAPAQPARVTPPPPAAPPQVFLNLPTEVGATEAEEIGVEHLLRDVKDASVSTLASEVRRAARAALQAAAAAGARPAAPPPLLPPPPPLRRLRSMAAARPINCAACRPQTPTHPWARWATWWRGCAACARACWRCRSTWRRWRQGACPSTTTSCATCRWARG